ncbi:MAG: hypothetical protein HQM09_01530 [Candidatus Riflebacteria bacterium]|nr:hypothetical protein [Candidatus Riflebacteria bacterium]
MSRTMGETVVRTKRFETGIKLQGRPNPRMAASNLKELPGAATARDLQMVKAAVLIDD